MSAVLEYRQQLWTTNCCTCGVAFAIPPDLKTQRLEDKNWFYCPNGHPQRFTESEADKLQRLLEEQKRSTEWWKNSAAAKDSQLKDINIQLGKVKAKLKRTEIRVSNGVCPCCNRSFQNVMRHMKTKHPDYVEGAK